MNDVRIDFISTISDLAAAVDGPSIVHLLQHRRYVVALYQVVTTFEPNRSGRKIGKGIRTDSISASTDVNALAKTLLVSPCSMNQIICYGEVGICERRDVTAESKDSLSTRISDFRTCDRVVAATVYEKTLLGDRSDNAAVNRCVGAVYKG